LSVFAAEVVIVPPHHRPEEAFGWCSASSAAITIFK
jgi:hypothetical protein